MHNHEIEAMVAALKPLLPDATSQQEAAKLLSGYWSDRIAVVWTTSDVHQHVNSEGWVITEDEAMEALQVALDNHDATVGITWESFSGSRTFPLPRRHKAFCENGGFVVLQPNGRCRRCT